jgi:CBS domain-containing protein
MKVKELMSADAIKYCSPETKLANVAKIMNENNLGALPVVDQSHKVVGIITDRHICISLGKKPDMKISDLKVQDVMASGKVHTVKDDQTLEDALREMRKARIGRLPVTDENGKLKGMLSINNILSHAIMHKQEIGSLTSSNESLAKTIKALFDRNNAVPAKKQEQSLEF